MDGIARPTSRGEGGGGGGGAAGGRDGVVGGGVVIGGGRGVVANHNCGGANEGGVDGSEKVVAAGEGVAARVAGGGLAGLHREALQRIRMVHPPQRVCVLWRFILGGFTHGSITEDHEG